MRASILLMISSSQIISLTLIRLSWGIYSTELYIVSPEFSISYGLFLSLIPIFFSFLLIRLMKVKGFKPLIIALQSLIVGTSVYMISLPFLSCYSFTIFVLSFILSALALIYGNNKVRNLYAVFFSSLSSILLALTLPLCAILALSAALAIFDIYSVFKGPLSKGIPPFVLSANVSGLSIGIGDLIFYSLIPASLLIDKGLLIAVTGCVLINVGALISMSMLRVKRMLPGLPIPFLLSLPLFFL